MSYNIKLADGTEIKNVELNGNNFITQDSEIRSALTPANLTSVEISDETSSQLCENMILTNLWEAPDGWHFIIREMTESEKLKLEIEAKLEYLAMMTDVEL